MLLLLLPAAALAAAPAAWPRPAGPVADYAKVIDPDHVNRITALAMELLNKTGASLVVATLPSLGDRSVEEAAVDLFQAWGIGKKGEDRGVLILVAVAERRLRIEVGYGLEGVVTDAAAGRVRDQDLVPFLKKNQYGPGLLAGAQGVARLIASERGLELSGAPKPKPRSNTGWGLAGLFFGLLIFWLTLRVAARQRGTGGLLNAVLLGSLLGGGRGGGYRGGGGGFGGFGGGGFGGFGGGMSGGGGASGGF